MAVAPDTVTVTAQPGVGEGSPVTVTAAFEMRPTDPEIKEAVVGIVGVSEVRGWGETRAPLRSDHPRTLV
jgi:hypothetical protein